MKISIIVPVYNGQDTVAQCVESFVNQDYPNCEIILVENNSTDASLAVCQQLQARYEQVKAIHIPGKGVSAARNAGLQLACGDVIGFADADDTAYGESLSMVAKEFESFPECAMVVGGIRTVGVSGRVKLKCVPQSETWQCEKLLPRIIYDENIMGSVCNKFFRKELVKGETFDTTLSFCEDTHFVAKVLSGRKNDKIRMISEPVYNYMDNPSSATHNPQRMFDENQKLHYNNAMDKIILDCGLRGRSKRVVKRAKFILATSVFYGYPVTSAQRDSLKRDMGENLWAFLSMGLLDVNITIDYLKRYIKGHLRK